MDASRIGHGVTRSLRSASVGISSLRRDQALHGKSQTLNLLHSASACWRNKH